MFNKYYFLAVLNRNAEATLDMVFKNGTEVEAYTVHIADHNNGVVNALLYLDNLEKMFDEMEQDYEKMYEQIRCMLLTSPKPQVTDMNNWDFVKDKLVLGAQKKSEEQIIKQGMLDLDIYVRLILNENMSCKVTKNHAAMWNKTENEVFEKAKENAMNLHTAINLFAFCLDLQGIPEDLAPFFSTNDPDAPTIIHYEGMPYGAGCICLTEIFNKLCEQYNTNELIIFPSSIHELIVHKKEENITWEAATELVSAANAEVVEWDEQVVNHVYGFKKKKNQSFLFIP